LCALEVVASGIDDIIVQTDAIGEARERVKGVDINGETQDDMSP
jgi:hypothetical protein